MIEGLPKSEQIVPEHPMPRVMMKVGVFLKGAAVNFLLGPSDSALVEQGEAFERKLANDLKMDPDNVKLINNSPNLPK